MDVCVRHFESEDSHSHLYAGEGALDGHGHFFGELHVFTYFVVFHVEDVVHLATRNDQRVSFLQWVDVEESVELIAFGAFVAGYFSSGYFRENVHNVRHSVLSRLIYR